MSINIEIGYYQGAAVSTFGPEGYTGDVLVDHKKMRLLGTLGGYHVCQDPDNSENIWFCPMFLPIPREPLEVRFSSEEIRTAMVNIKNLLEVLMCLAGENVNNNADNASYITHSIVSSLHREAEVATNILKWDKND